MNSIASGQIPNLLENVNLTYGRYINDNGGLSTSTVAVYVTDFIDIENITDLIFTSYSATQYSLRNTAYFYDENQQPMGSLIRLDYDDAGTMGGGYIYNTNAKYVRICFYLRTAPSLDVGLYDVSNKLGEPITTTPQ